jgi:osmoprotectant transport system ATP-binding protein
MSAIRFIDVTKTFPDASSPAIRSCSFTVPSGNFVVLLGPSGCGKTTSLKIVNRLYEPTSGTVTIGGTDIRELEPTELRRRIGYVIQQIGLFPHMTVEQNIAVVPDLLGWSRARQRQRVREMLTLVELPPEEYCGRYPAQLSGGEQQRVGVARALAGDPEVVLMDEPFGAIDAITRAALQDELLRLQRKLKKTVLFVTHDVEEALRLADRIVIMRRGQVVQVGTPLDILTQPTNAFVRELVGADDMVRQLSLLRVDKAMRALPAEYKASGTPTISCDADLRRALSLLLQSGGAALTVVDDGVPVGLLTLEDVRSSTLVGAGA